MNSWTTTYVIVAIIVVEVAIGVGRILLRRGARAPAVPNPLPHLWTGSVWVWNNVPEELAVLLSFLFLEAALMYIGAAAWWHLIYVAGILILSLVLRKISGWRLLTPLFMLFAAFAIFGWNGFSKHMPDWNVSSVGTTTRNCDGRIHRDVRVDRNGKPLNHGCSFAFEVTNGTLFFNGPEGRTEEWWPGKQAMVGQQRKIIVTAQAVTDEATLDYLLCPPNSAISNWECH